MKIASCVGTGKVKLDRAYCLVDDVEQKPIDIEQKIKGYQYGKQLVPVTALDEKLLAHEEAKCMKMLGFCKKSQVPRHHYLGGVDILTTTPDNANNAAFTSMAKAMQEADKVMICRYLPRDNNTPHLVVLSPRIWIINNIYRCFC